jgi:hypothetical protein
VKAAGASWKSGKEPYGFMSFSFITAIGGVSSFTIT